MQEQKMVERKKDEKTGKESGMNDQSESGLGTASGGSNFRTPNQSKPYEEADRDKQFSREGSESQSTGRRGETGTGKNLQTEDNPGLKKDVNKDWPGSEATVGDSPNTEGHRDEGTTTEKNEEEKKGSDKEEWKRKSST